MPSLKHIKSRMGNVATAEKVAFSMKNISSAKLSQARKFLNSSKDYLSINNEILSYMLQAYKENEIVQPNTYISNFFMENTELPKLLIVVGSDRGLCGGFNAAVIKLAESEIKSLQEKDQKFLVLPIGNKIKNYFNNHYPNKIKKLDQKFEIKTFNTEQALITTNFIAKILEEGKAAAVSVIYTEFTSVMHNTPVISNIFPLNFNVEEDDKKSVESNLNLVTDNFIKDAFNYIVHDIVLSWVYKIILESLASEHVARVNAMDNSYNNAGELLKDLSLEYNRTRQALITKELIEIISGTESL
ncbi:ATP synthase F1 subunit gamma [Rickettsiales bacterium LUAb2]